MTTLAVLQPGYLPWLGFFEQMKRADVFVFYDDVQYDKNGWRNRNRIKGPKGAEWITVPVLQKGRMGQILKDVEIDNRGPWPQKHLRTLRERYAKAPYVDDVIDDLGEILERRWLRLADLDIEIIGLMGRWLGIETITHRSSDLALSGDRNGRLLELSKFFGASRYYSGASAKSYLDTSLFSDQGITVQWQTYDHPVYRQQHGDFVSHLSAIDLIFNEGPRSGRILSLCG